MNTKSIRTRFLLLFAALASLCGAGCQVTSGGQTLPSPYYQTDDVQYFAPGNKFPLSREAAALKAYQAESSQQQRGGAPRP